MSTLVLGAAQFGLNYGINNKIGQVDAESLVQLLKLAWDNGIREIDTAQDYGNSEKALSICLEKVQKNFLVHSKFILKDNNVQDLLKASLANLNIPDLGYFYFHRFADYQSYKGGSLSHCLGIGVSVYEDHELEISINDPLVKAVQIAMNVFDCSENKIKLIKMAQLAGKKIYIRSVFLQGLIFMSAEELPIKLQSFSEPLKKLNEIGKKNGLDMKSLALGFIKSVVPADGVLIGVDSKKQLIENVDAWKTELNSTIINEIKSIKISDEKLLRPVNWL